MPSAFKVGYTDSACDTDTAQTPNGIKVSILLEELGLSYEVRNP